jgi:hypothetical protein
VRLWCVHTASPCRKQQNNGKTKLPKVVRGSIRKSWTYSDKSVLVPAHPLNIILLRDLIALVQASAAREARRRDIVVVIILVFSMVVVASAHGRFGSRAAATTASSAASTTVARRPGERGEAACVVSFDSTTEARCFACSRVRGEDLNRMVDAAYC